MLRRPLNIAKNVVMAHRPPKNPLIVVLGATGTGKSELAISLALRFNGEVINGDAMQLYQGLPIVTNKVTTEEMRGIPHHLLGEIGLDQDTWQVGKFRREASRVIREIRQREKVPVLVGGTHYYTQSLILGDTVLVGEESMAGSEKQEHSDCDGRHEKLPILDEETEAILNKLREVDPIMADRWHPRDRRKIQRSLEIYLTTGRRASDIYAEKRAARVTNPNNEPKSANSDREANQDKVVDLSSTLFFWVHAEDVTLKRRLDGRVEKMLNNGLLAEITAMDAYVKSQDRPIDFTRGIWASIGYKEFAPYLALLNDTTRDSTPEPKAELKAVFDLSIEMTQAATRRYAKRQVRWIRRKLLPELKESGVLQQLYLVDGTDLTQWEKNVIQPAEELTKEFFEGREMRSPSSICDAAESILNRGSEDADGSDDGVGEVKTVWPRHVCEACGVTAVTETQWDTHLKSRKHRSWVKRTKKGVRDTITGKFITISEVSEGQDLSNETISVDELSRTNGASTGIIPP